MSRLDHTLVREFEAALAWWQAAGVDCDFTDDATAWLAEAPLDAAPLASPGGASAAQGTSSRSRQSPEARTPRSAAPLALAPEPAAAAPRRNRLGDSPPADLAAFRQWWMEATDLSPATGFARVPPRGNAGAALMVLVPQPEAGDGETLLAGPQGRLLSNILAAMGLDDSAVYIASALPSHTPMADLAALAADGMDAVTAHHVALVAPQRLLALGTGLAPMLGMGTEASGDPALREINQAGRKTPAMVSETLDAMMNMPRLKARFWRRWMEWSATS
jgi:uracil-DNA glycosylase